MGVLNGTAITSVCDRRLTDASDDDHRLLLHISAFSISDDQRCSHHANSTSTTATEHCLGTLDVDDRSNVPLQRARSSRCIQLRTDSPVDVLDDVIDGDVLSCTTTIANIEENHRIYTDADKAATLSLSSPFLGISAVNLLRARSASIPARRSCQPATGIGKHLSRRYRMRHMSTTIAMGWDSR